MAGGILKRLFVLSLSLVLFLFDQARRSWGRLVGKPAPGTCVVLEYHSVLTEHREKFARQMDILRHMATPVRADLREKLAPSRRHVAVTFDDGLVSFAENALPELDKRGIPAAVFVATDRLGIVPNWTNYSPGARPTERMLSAEELRRLPGTVLIGSHGATHEKLTKLSEPEARREIEGSRRQLEDILGREVRLFSFPYGAFSEQVLSYCRAAGYERVFTNLPLLAFSDPHEFVTARVVARASDWPLEFRLKLAGSYRWLPQAFNLKRALLKGLRRHSERAMSARHETRLRLP